MSHYASGNGHVTSAMLPFESTLATRVLENKLLPTFVNPGSSCFSQVNLLQRKCDKVVQAYSESILRGSGI